MIEEWAERIRAAAAAGEPLRPRGGGSKDFYGRSLRGEVLDTRPWQGIVNYEPTELVVTVKAGTPLAELEAALAEREQMLGFEPPHFGAATVGGCVAAGLSGPRRASAGAVRDFVLGLKMLDGRGEAMAFGGEVMKNVAGYDVSRLMAGSLGTLGLITELSLKVLPRPVAESTLRFEMDEGTALQQLNRWGGQPLPISASCWHGGLLHLRLSGAAAAVAAAREKLGGEALDPQAAIAFWADVREHRHPALAGGGPLWRLSLPSTAASVGLPGEELVEWGGALRWLSGEVPGAEVRRRAVALGGHAACFRGGERDAQVFQPLEPTLLSLQRRLKASFDPAGIFSPGRLYPEF